MDLPSCFQYNRSKVSPLVSLSLPAALICNLLSICSCIKTPKPTWHFQMCRRIHYWNKCRQQTVVRLRWRQRAQEVFQRICLFKVNLCLPSLTLFCHSFLLPQSQLPSAILVGKNHRSLLSPQCLSGFLPSACFFLDVCVCVFSSTSAE